MFTGMPVKNEQQANNLISAILLFSEFAVIKIEAHTKKTAPELSGRYPSCLSCKGNSRIFKVVAHVNEVHDPYFPDFCHPDVLATWQQPTSESEKLRWANTGCKFNEQSGQWEAQDSCLVLLRSLANLILCFLHSFFHHGAFKMAQILNNIGRETSIKLQKQLATSV